jgi:alkaline phosphatase D
MSDLVGVTRRGFLAGGMAAAASVALVRSAAGSSAQGHADLFSLGVASGAPIPGGVTLWTRLASAPLEPDGGLPHRPIRVQWQLSQDQRFASVLRSGSVLARPEDVHAVHVDVSGLEPDRWFYYRFRCGSQISRVGRTRTLPSTAASKASLVLAMVSCQRFEDGYYTAYRHLAGQDVDLVVHTGDYIYENVFSTGPRRDQVPNHLSEPANDLTSYRLRHALYRLDPDLQQAHAAAPWMLIPDNHDAVDDGDRSAALRARRAAAYRAYFEHLPLAAGSRPQGASMRIHTSLDYGALARLHLLDTRQYRDDQQICGEEIIGPPCAGLDDPARSILGLAQEQWLATSLTTSAATWNPVAQTVLFTPYDFASGPGRGIYYASWDGYPAARRRLLAAMTAPAVHNPVMLSADWHTAWVNDVAHNPDRPDGGAAMTEFLTTGVSSNSAFTSGLTTPSMAENPQVRFYDDRCGYSLCTITPDAWRTDFYAADTTSPDGVVEPVSSWTIETGQRIAHPT